MNTHGAGEDGLQDQVRQVLTVLEQQSGRQFLAVNLKGTVVAAGIMQHKCNASDASGEVRLDSVRDMSQALFDLRVLAVEYKSQHDLDSVIGYRFTLTLRRESISSDPVYTMTAEKIDLPERWVEHNKNAKLQGI